MRLKKVIAYACIDEKKYEKRKYAYRKFYRIQYKYIYICGCSIFSIKLFIKYAYLHF